MCEQAHGWVDGQLNSAAAARIETDPLSPVHAFTQASNLWPITILLLAPLARTHDTHQIFRWCQPAPPQSWAGTREVGPGFEPEMRVMADAIVDCAQSISRAVPLLTCQHWPAAQRDLPTGEPYRRARRQQSAQIVNDSLQPASRFTSSITSRICSSRSIHSTSRSACAGARGSTAAAQLL